VCCVTDDTPSTERGCYERQGRERGVRYASPDVERGHTRFCALELLLRPHTSQPNRHRPSIDIHPIQRSVSYLLRIRITVNITVHPQHSQALQERVRA